MLHDSQDTLSQCVQEIKKWLIIYFVGNVIFILLALATIFVSTYIVFFGAEYYSKSHFILFGCAGVFLLFEVTKALVSKQKLPSDIVRINYAEYPSLFKIINEVTTKLGLQNIRDVYTCPGVNAAIFTEQRSINFFKEPPRKLLVGKGVLTQLDDDELRAVLYHEFGHYAQKELSYSTSTYRVAQLSRSFLSIDNRKDEGMIKMQLRSQVDLLSYFTIWICHKIDVAYNRMSLYMEYEADDVAVRYIGANNLYRALNHVVALRHNYNAVEWGKRRLKAEGISMSDTYTALRLITMYAQCPKNLFPKAIDKRMSRLNNTNCIPGITPKTSVMLNANTKTLPNGNSKECSPEMFAIWMQKGMDIYNKALENNRSVYLEIHLQKNIHRLPLCDGQYRILLDDTRVLGYGNFKKGYLISRRISPGKHSVCPYAPTGIEGKPIEHDFVSGHSYRIEMDYKLFKKNGCIVFPKEIVEI